MTPSIVRILAVMTTMLAWVSRIHNMKTFWPIVRPLDEKVYIIDIPSGSTVSQTLAGCAAECFFRGYSGSTCLFFNYNTTSMNCSVFEVEPTDVAVDGHNKTFGYQVT